MGSRASRGAVGSGAYRKRFLRANPGPVWRCRYCGRRLGIAELTVDHIVPVSAYRKGRRFAFWALSRLGASGIHDLPNLAPSCKRCNSSKGAKMGRWTFLGAMGRHRWFRPVWVSAHVAACIVLVAVVTFALSRMVSRAGVQLVPPVW